VPQRGALETIIPGKLKWATARDDVIIMHSYFNIIECGKQGERQGERDTSSTTKDFTTNPLTSLEKKNISLYSFQNK
jgi:hypothetical protein